MTDFLRDGESLRHYSHKPIISVFSRKQEETTSPYDKPRGLWVSLVAGETDGWADWCEAESFGGGWSHVYRVSLATRAQILRLSTATDLDAFAMRYHCEPRRGRLGIDWTKVAGDWSGIIIAPYIWQRRLSPGCDWYYVWDCASGCVWDANAVERLERVAAQEAVA